MVISFDLEPYLTHDWAEDKTFNSLMNVVASRKFQPSRKLKVTPNPNNSMQMLSAVRIDTCQERYGCQRLYNHRSFQYDNMNELERYGMGRYCRDYIAIVSFEDSLDFIYSCLFKTKSGDLRKFCAENDLDYKIYSRQQLGGGHYKDLTFNDLYGFSPSFDIVINSLESSDTVEYKLLGARILRFCESLRNSLLVVLGNSITDDGNSILASAGLSSLVYYCDRLVDGEVESKYKAYSTKLKILCVSRGDYINHLHEDLCS